MGNTTSDLLPKPKKKASAKGASLTEKQIHSSCAHTSAPEAGSGVKSNVFTPSQPPTNSCQLASARSSNSACNDTVPMGSRSSAPSLCLNSSATSAIISSTETQVQVRLSDERSSKLQQSWVSKDLTPRGSNKLQTSSGECAYSGKPSSEYSHDGKPTKACIDQQLPKCQQDDKGSHGAGQVELPAVLPRLDESEQECVKCSSSSTSKSCVVSLAQAAINNMQQQEQEQEQQGSQYLQEQKQQEQLQQHDTPQQQQEQLRQHDTSQQQEEQHDMRQQEQEQEQHGLLVQDIPEPLSIDAPQPPKKQRERDAAVAAVTGNAYQEPKGEELEALLNAAATSCHKLGLSKRELRHSYSAPGDANQASSVMLSLIYGRYIPKDKRPPQQPGGTAQGLDASARDKPALDSCRVSDPLTQNTVATKNEARDPPSRKASVLGLGSPALAEQYARMWGGVGSVKRRASSRRSSRLSSNGSFSMPNVGSGSFTFPTTTSAPQQQLQQLERRRARLEKTQPSQLARALVSSFRTSQAASKKGKVLAQAGTVTGRKTRHASMLLAALPSVGGLYDGDLGGFLEASPETHTHTQTRHASMLLAALPSVGGLYDGDLGGFLEASPGSKPDGGYTMAEAKDTLKMLQRAHQHACLEEQASKQQTAQASSSSPPKASSSLIGKSTGPLMSTPTSVQSTTATPFSGATGTVAPSVSGDPTSPQNSTVGGRRKAETAVGGEAARANSGSSSGATAEKNSGRRRSTLDSISSSNSSQSLLLPSSSRSAGSISFRTSVPGGKPSPRSSGAMAGFEPSGKEGKPTGSKRINVQGKEASPIKRGSQPGGSSFGVGLLSKTLVNSCKLNPDQPVCRLVTAHQLSSKPELNRSTSTMSGTSRSDPRT